MVEPPWNKIRESDMGAATEQTTDPIDLASVGRCVAQSIIGVGAEASDAALPTLQLIYDTAPIGLAFLTPDCRYVRVNQRLTEICGISVADHIGKSVRETVPQVAEQVEQIVHTILCTGEPIVGIEINGQRPDNAERFWKTYWHPLKDPEGIVVGINVAAEEITASRHAQAALIASEQRLRDLADSLVQRVAAEVRERDRIWNVSQDLLVVADSGGRIMRVNPAWTATLGWSQDDLIEKTAEWLTHPDDLDKGRIELQNLVAGQKTTRFENRLRDKQGNFCCLSWRAVRDGDLIFAVARDITDLKRAEDQLRTSHRELERVSRQTTLGAMTASIAHEVSQPLAAIITNGNAGLRWLERTDADIDEVRAALTRIVSEGHRTSEVIAGIRRMFIKNRSDKTTIDLNCLIGEVISLVQGELESHQIILQCDKADGLPRLRAERVQLQQVLINLILNAVEAMSSVGKGERLLKIRSGLGGPNFVAVSVEDSGPGIDPEIMVHIFDDFFTTKPHGMGMGLSICRSIVELHGGNLWANTRSPRGAVFHIRLPSVCD
jgi:PAS domain S-box-containing protein